MGIRLARRLMNECITSAVAQATGQISITAPLHIGGAVDRAKAGLDAGGIGSST